MSDADRSVLRPVLAGPWRLIGPNPDLGPLQGARERAEGVRPQECVDHHVFQSADGAWHLWGCIRHTAIGRLLYHWEAPTITDAPWRMTGELFRPDRAASESIDDWHDEDWLQSPYVVHWHGRYWMFYGGHSTGRDAAGRPATSRDSGADCQICLMTSPDGRTWTRHRNAEGLSRVFVGPGEARDPCVLQIEGKWHCYYAGHLPCRQDQPAFFVRTSDDLVSWSDWTVVHQDLALHPSFWGTECPHVVQRGGRFYLFRTENYGQARSHVLVSDDPTDFGRGESGRHYLGLFPVAAPEIIVTPAGDEYITSNHDLTGGTRLAPLRWE